jgi:uncharacterized protein
MSPIEQLLKEYQELPEFAGIVLDSVQQPGGWKSTPLHIAIYRERPAEVKILLGAGADANTSGEYGERPLQVAVNCFNTEIIEMLLLAGASCELRDDKGMDVWRVADVLHCKEKFEEIVSRVSPSQIRTKPR